MFDLDKKSGIELTESSPQVTDSYAIPSAIGQGTNNFTVSQLARYVSAVSCFGAVPGAWDNGEHVYEFAFAPHAPFQTETALKLGRRLNRKPLAFPHRDTPDGGPIALPGFNRDNLVVSSLRRQEDGSWILRAYEALGRSTPARLHLPPDVSAIFESDLQERQWHPLDPEKMVFAPFEIKTLLLRRK